MTDLAPWRTGAALALTIAVGYSACALIFGLWPEATVPFLNALFHALDFSPLDTGAPWPLAAFVFSLLALTIWGFLVGTLFAWLRNCLGRSARNA